jgi:anti-sigma factor RsiW
MSHLGERLSALIDGELSGAERDRAYAHLAGCVQCRTEAAQLRALKQKLRSLVEGAPADAALTRRLISMPGSAGPSPPRRALLRVAPGPRPRSMARQIRRPARPGAHRRRYLLLGTVSLVVGLGTAAFTAGGGGQAAPGPKITPPVELYSVEHAIITGEVPFSGPSSRPISSHYGAPQP